MCVIQGNAAKKSQRARVKDTQPGQRDRVLFIYNYIYIFVCEGVCRVEDKLQALIGPLIPGSLGIKLR